MHVWQERLASLSIHVAVIENSLGLVKRFAMRLKFWAKSLDVLKRGGKLISISGPPDPSFGKEIGAPSLVRLIMRLLSVGVRRRASGRGASYAFLFMKSNGKQLREIASLFDQGVLSPVVDRVFPFASTIEAMAYVESGRAKGKVVIKIKST